MPRIKEIRPLAGFNDPKILEGYTNLVRNRTPDAEPKLIEYWTNQQLEVIFTMQYLKDLKNEHPHDIRIFHTAALLATLNLDMLQGKITKEEFAKWQEEEREILLFEARRGKPKMNFREQMAVSELVKQLKIMGMDGYGPRTQLDVIETLEMITRMVPQEVEKAAIVTLDYLYTGGNEQVKELAEAALRRITIIEGLE